MAGRFLSTAFAVSCFAASSFASTCEAQFPLVRAADDGALAPSASALERLRPERAVRLSGVEIAPAMRVDLELERVDAPVDDTELVIDGAHARRGLADVDVTLWKGRVDGDPASDVFLAFSALGSRGWVRTEGELVHLLASPGASGDWTQSTSRWVRDADLIAAGATVPGSCLQEELAQPGGAVPAPTATTPGGTSALGSGATTLVCRIAVETDTQLFNVFGNVNAELVYVVSLFTAGSARYHEQINTVLSLAYLALYTGSDPWATQEANGSSIDLLFEFQGAWQGSIPAGAHLAHFFSGDSLGGGVAWLDVLCDTTYGFAVSGNLAGLTPFPIVQGPLNWDFMVWTHETGHNFGSPHTHDFCPPLDSCAPSGYFGQCQTSQTCITNGTIMSYCHLCPGGLSSIDPQFHPQCVATMRAEAEASCLGAFCTAPTAYCVGAPNSAGPGASMSSSGTTSVAAANFVARATGLPANTSALFYYGNNRTQSAFGNGFRCVNGSTFRLPLGVSNGSGVFQTALNFGTSPVGVGAGKIDAGEIWNFQCWYRNPAAGGAGFNLSNGLEVHFCP